MAVFWRLHDAPVAAGGRGQIEAVEADENGTAALDAMQKRFPHFADPRTLMTMLEVCSHPITAPPVRVSTLVRTIASQYFDMCFPAERLSPAGPTVVRLGAQASRLHLPRRRTGAFLAWSNVQCSRKMCVVGRLSTLELWPHLCRATHACTNSDLDIFPRALFPTFTCFFNATPSYGASTPTTGEDL